MSGIDLAGNCPECGHSILDKCFWCSYDLSNTAPDANCPECGVPAINSIGNGVLDSVPLERLRSIHSGFKLVTTLILAYIVWIVGIVVALFMTSLMMIDSYVFGIFISLITNGITLGIIYGWWKIASPIPNLPQALSVQDQRKFLQVTTIITASLIGISAFYAFVPDNPDYDAPLKLVDLFFMIISIASYLAIFAFYIAQMLYLQWFARLVKNQKMYKRSKHMIWSGPLISIVGAFVFMLGPLIVLVLYWNMVEYLRRDVKAIIKARTSLAT